MPALQSYSEGGLGRACAALALAHRARAEDSTLPPLRRRLHSLPAGFAVLGSTLRDDSMLPARAFAARSRAGPSSSWLWRAREGMGLGAAGTRHKRPQQAAAGCGTEG